MYFETTIKGALDNGEGLLKRVTLRLFVEAETFAEAEEKSYAHWEEEGVQGMEVTGCRKSNFLGVKGDWSSDDCSLYKFVTEMTIMDDRGKDKKIREAWLIGSAGIEEAEDVGRRELMATAPFPVKMVELKRTNLDAVLLVEEYED